ncbi:hypothetical protein [Paenibacillus sp. EKM205P]|uniref:hypothetical protein n=1 Tax=Paenibacillus sp. EKM205P TaxID=1683673 RepID=UPI0013EA96C7|nr:hypothetical protein [Paenibacillus sp. EKM205P]KAF6591063.1 hypothetical protein G9G52_01425 [Paenibacillus sp. EKM205P]
MVEIEKLHKLIESKEKVKILNLENKELAEGTIVSIDDSHTQLRINCARTSKELCFNVSDIKLYQNSGNSAHWYIL